MRNIYLAPRSNETAYKNYMSSMQGKPIEKFVPYLDKEEISQLEGDEKYFVWGCQPSLRSRWENMQLGDYIFFYARGRFISVGKLKFKKYSETLALSLWPKSNDSGKPWSCVFFVEDIHSIDLPLDEFNAITGYNMPALQGFMQVVQPKALARIRDKYGSNEGFVESLASGISDYDLEDLASISTKNSTDMTNEDISRLDGLTLGKTEKDIEKTLARFVKSQQNKSPEQVEKLVKSYKRNKGLITTIKIKYENKCQICGFTFKTSSGESYSEAAHIIPISSGEKGVDSPDNIWVLCPNHHKMLDYGAIKAIDNSHYEIEGITHKLECR